MKLGLVLAALAVSTVSTWALGPAKLTFTESYRKDFSSHPTFNGSESESSLGGHWNLHVELTPKSEVLSDLNGDSTIEIKVGSMQYKGKLSDDPHYTVGKTSADLLILSPNPSGTSKTISSTVHVKWADNQLVINVAGGWDSIAAKDYTSNYQGDVSGVTHAFIKLTGQKTSDTFEMDVAFKGNVKVKSSNKDDVTKETVTVDLKGQGPS
jgi:hypothetical protein